MPITFQHKPGLIAYLTIGDPDLGTSRDIALAAIDEGADMIELGVPFSDPVADGPVIQRASERALRMGASLEDVVKLGSEVRKLRPQVGLIVFSYLNPILRFGIGHFAQRAAEAGLDGALITDLTVEESGDYLRAMRAHDLATVFLAAPTSTDKRLKMIAEASRGFIYAVSRTGVTGERQRIASDAAELVARIRKASDLPVAVGFGISTAEQFQAVGGFADAVVIGSAIVSLVEKQGQGAPRAVAEFISGLREACSQEKGKRWTSQIGD